MNQVTRDPLKARLCIMKNRYEAYKNTILQICSNIAIYGMVFCSCNSLDKKNAETVDWLNLDMEPDNESGEFILSA